MRDPELYPLKDYIDLADLTLEMDASNLNRFVAGLSHADLGIRYWSTLGILNLTLVGDAAHSPAVKSALLNKLADDQESQVIRSYMAWILIRIGEREAGFAFLEQQIEKTYTSRTVLNILDWMDQPEAIALIVKNYLSASQKSSDQTKVMVAKLIEEAPTELASLIEQREKLRNFSKARAGRLKKLKNPPSNMSAEKLAEEKAKAQSELAEAKAKMKLLDPQIQDCL